MELLNNGFTLQIYDGCFPLSTDSMVLADFVKLPRQAHVLDLGAGAGTLGLLLCAKRDDCHVTGIELDPTAHNCALDNVARNNLGNRMTCVCGDLRSFQPALGSFDVCISNPPYFTGGPAAKLTGARRTDTCVPEDLFRAAQQALKYGGDFFLVHKPENLAQLIACAADAKLEAKRLCLVRNKPTDAVSLVLIQFRKGAKPGLRWEELCLQDAKGDPTEAYKKIYHL